MSRDLKSEITSSMSDSSISEVTLKTIESYKHMALDSSKRKVLLNDKTCISFLVYVLDDSNKEIVKKALHTLLLLSEHSDSRIILKHCYGMLLALENIIKDVTVGETEIHNLAKKIYQYLTEKNNQPLKDTHNLNRDTSRRLFKKQISRSIFVGGSGSKAKTVVLEVSGLVTKDHRQECQEQLLKVKGVISITFDSFKRRCVLRTKPELKPEILVFAINATDHMSAQQVVKNESGQEVLVSFGEVPLSVNKENFPEYLPEDDSPIKVEGDKAIARQSVIDSKNKSWFTAATDFFSKSFYW